MSKILVISPHPDDETLGCGGSLLKHSSNRDEIFWLIITNIFTDHGWPEITVNKRKKEIEKAAGAYGFSEVFKLEHPTAELEKISSGVLIEEIKAVLAKTGAETVYIPHSGDVHTDHKITAKAAESALKTFRSHGVRKILSYETLSETEFSMIEPEIFSPNLFVDITGYIQKKIEIMKIFESEIKEPPFPRSEENILALATYRGSRAGYRYAEALRILFEKD